MQASSRPLVTVITINLNNALGLLRTIRSVVSQKFENVEYIVVDGGSNDKSAKVIQEHSFIISRFISEKDRGIYNAMNKGLRLAAGEYVAFLNSGDIFISKPNFERIIQRHRGKDVIYGNIGILRNKRMVEVCSPQRIYFSKNYQHRMPFLPATAIRRDLCLKHNGFDERYRISADVALLCRIFYDAKVSSVRLNTMVTLFDETGISSRKPYLGILERFSFILTSYPQYLPAFTAECIRSAFKKAFCLSRRLS